MRVCSWEGADPQTVRPLYAAEEAHWRTALHWDTRRQWLEVEQARTRRLLPGLLALDAEDRTRGWTFCLPEDGVLQLGGLVADSAEATEALLDGLLSGPAAQATDTVCGFMVERAVSLGAAFVRRGFEVDRFHYLTLDLPAVPDAPPEPGVGPGPAGAAAVTVAAWQADALPAVGALFRSAYERRIGRYFAPHDRPDEWRRYAENLVAQPGCGEFRADLSLMAGDPRQPGAVLLMTGLDADTAHIAQLAVAPAWRRQRLARRLVTEAARGARRAGFRRLTLLVAEANLPARALYAGLRFVGRASFVAAFREPASSVRVPG